MASIEKRGDSYRIIVTDGKRLDGAKNKHTRLWKPEPGMTPKQIEKALIKAAMAFETEIQKGFIADDRQIFAEYAEYVISLKEANGLKLRTAERYRSMLPRINQAIGRLPIRSIRPQHLNSFYKNLSEAGIRNAQDKAIAKKNISSIAEKKNLSSIAAVAKKADCAASTISPAFHGKTVSLLTAQKIATALDSKVETLFLISKDCTKLSSKTVLEHHRLISMILSQAEKEMIVEYNAAAKATPPKVDKHEVESFTPEEIEWIVKCLDLESIKWRTLTHLLIMSGCRRGEACGLKWDNIDWQSNQIKIERTLNYLPGHGIYEDSTKTRETRFIKLPQETMALLRTYQRWHENLKEINGDRWINSGYVFTRDDGSAMNPDNVTQWLDTFSKKYGLPHIHPHAFRHSMASLLIHNGTDILAVSKRLGHANTTTTLNIYSHALAEADEAAAESIADCLIRKKA